MDYPSNGSATDSPDETGGGHEGRYAGRLRRLVGLVAVLLLAGLAAWSVVVLQPPEPVPADAPARVFSAERAFEHVERIAVEPHVTGSVANEQVRRYIVGVLNDLGIPTRVQEAVGFNVDGPRRVDATGAKNIVAMIPGTDPTARLFLVAHYDSVQNGPGAADDASGVAALLETARALKAGPPPRNDIVILFTDAEEAGLLGAEAFVSQHPLATEGGVVLNLEARGSGGPPIMFETSLGNANLIDVFDAVAPYPVATSFAVEVYRVLPNDTDFSVFLDAGGFTGLNTAFIGDSASYHTPQDKPARLNPASLQAIGANTLALARALGNADLGVLSERAAYDATYFPVMGELVRYPGWLVWPIAVLAFAAVVGLAVLTVRNGMSSSRRTVAGFGLTLVPLVLAPVAAQALWALLVAVRPGYSGMLDPWRPGWYRLAVVALVLAVLLAWYALLRRRVGPAALAIGGLGWLAVLGIVVAALAPGGSYLFALPALAGGIAGVVAVLVRQESFRLIAPLIGSGVAVLLLAPAIALFFQAVGLSTAVAPGLFVVLLGMALLPVLDLLFPGPVGPRRRRARAGVPAVATIVAVALTAAGLSVATFDARHPAPSQLLYALDAESGRAWWLSEREPEQWASQYLEGKRDLREAFPILYGEIEGKVHVGPARAAELPAPEVTVLADEVIGRRRAVTVRIDPRRPVRSVAVDVSAPGEIVSASVAGRALPAEALGHRRLTVTFHGPPAEGVEISFVVAATGAIRLRVVDASYGLKNLPGFVPRSTDVGVAGTHISELVLVAATERLP